MNSLVLVLSSLIGHQELVKLEALTFTDYPVVVHLDLDVVLLKPFDALFDVMLDETGDISKYRQTLGNTLMWPNRTLPERVDAFFTRDCKFKNSITRVLLPSLATVKGQVSDRLQFVLY